LALQTVAQGAKRKQAASDKTWLAYWGINYEDNKITGNHKRYGRVAINKYSDNIEAFGANMPH
jgi:hypothetical protein